MEEKNVDVSEAERLAQFFVDEANATETSSDHHEWLVRLYSQLMEREARVVTKLERQTRQRKRPSSEACREKGFALEE